MFKIKNVFLSSVAVSAVLLSSGAFAGTWYHSGDNCYSNCGSDSESSYGSTWSYSYEQNSSVTVKAWSDKGDYKNGQRKLGSSDLYKYSNGYGVDNKAEGSYERDNTSSTYDNDYVVDTQGHTDSVLFDYGDKCVVLDSISLGWKSGDADIRIMAFVGYEDKDGKLSDKNGSKYNSMSEYLSAKTYDDLMAEGDWKSYRVDGKESAYNNYSGNYEASFGYKQKSDGSYETDGSGRKIEDKSASRYWIVMGDKGRDGSNDYFKVKNMGGHGYDGTGCQKVEIKCDNGGGGNGNEVPAPAPLALMAIGLLGLGLTRRKAQK